MILRREETNATRSLANTAKVMASQPVLLRLKELEVMKEIAENIAEVRVVVGPTALVPWSPRSSWARIRAKGDEGVRRLRLGWRHPYRARACWRDRLALRGANDVNSPP